MNITEIANLYQEALAPVFGDELHIMYEQRRADNRRNDVEI